jgi:hypothetical protein
MLFTYISSMGLAIDIGFSVLLVYNPDELACSVGLNERGRIHLVAATLTANLALIFSFLWIVACTVIHYPDLRTVPTWQHYIRTAFSKLIPKFVTRFANPTGANCGGTEAEPGLGVNCPAYLVCLNENTAGKAEQAAWTAVLASVVLLIPTVVNLSLLMAFNGIVGAWPFLNSLWIEGMSCRRNVVEFTTGWLD